MKKRFSPLAGKATEPTRGVGAQENGLAPLRGCLPFLRRSPRKRAPNATEEEEEQATCPSFVSTQADMGEPESLGSEMSDDEGKPQSLSRSHVPTFFVHEEGSLELQTQSVSRPGDAPPVEESTDSCFMPRKDDGEMPATASCEMTPGAHMGTGDGNGKRVDLAGFSQTSFVPSVLHEEEECFHSPLSASLFSWFRETTSSDCASAVTAMSTASCVEGPVVELEEDCEWKDWDLLLAASCEEGGIVSRPLSSAPGLLSARAEDNRRHRASSPPESEVESKEALDDAIATRVLEQESHLAIRKHSWRSMTRRAAISVKCGVVTGGRFIAKKVRRRKASKQQTQRTRTEGPELSTAGWTSLYAHS